MSRKPAPVDPAAFIQANLPLLPVPAVPEIVLHTAQPGSGLWRLLERTANSEAPYWAYRWAGGTVLARHILDHPETVAGKRVLDLGAGSGIVGIAAAKSGAREVLAAEIDANGREALMLNARANGVTLTPLGGDLTVGPVPDVDLIAVGDLFYAPDLSERVTGFLQKCVIAGVLVLVGDPGRAHLPQAHLRRLAEYPVPDYGDAQGGAMKPSAVFAFVPQAFAKP